MASSKPLSIGRVLLLSLHGFIILNFLFEIAYASYMIFAVLLPPDGGGGPLFGRAMSMPQPLMEARRLYAIECWIAIAGLSAYLAITEIAPRFWMERLAGREE